MLLCISTCDTRSTLGTFHTHHTQMQLAESFFIWYIQIFIWFRHI